MHITNFLFILLIFLFLCFTNTVKAEPKSIIKIGIVQMDVKMMDKDYNLKRAFNFLDKLKGDVDIAVLPEFFTTGYHLDDIGNKFYDLAETIPGKTTEELAKYAKKNKIAIIGNIVEKDTIKTGVLYDTAFGIDKDGKLAGIYRKSHLYPTEHQYFKPGNDLPVFELSGTKIGLAICYDHAFGEIFRILALKGAQVFVIPSAVPKGYEYLLNLRTRARAQDNQIFAVAANRVGKEKKFIYAGNSLIVNPRGEIISKGSDQEEIIIGELNINQILDERKQEPIFRSRRPDLYKKEGIVENY